jgi:hypothetical protein
MIQLCKYGCGNPAKFDVGKKTVCWCCSETNMKCPVILAKLKIPKSPNRKQRTYWPKPWNTGKTLVELLGKERAAEIGRNMSNGLKGNPYIGRGKTPEIEEQKREKIRNSINQRYANGWMPKAGRCAKITHISPFAGVVLVDGSWEKLLAEYLDSRNINWVRNKKRFPYHFENKDRWYTPDFYIPDHDFYIEVKGYETEKDVHKWNHFPHPLFIVRKRQIKDIKAGKEILGICGTHR